MRVNCLTLAFGAQGAIGTRQPFPFLRGEICSRSRLLPLNGSGGWLCVGLLQSSPGSTATTCTAGGDVKGIIGSFEIALKGPTSIGIALTLWGGGEWQCFIELVSASCEGEKAAPPLQGPTLANCIPDHKWTTLWRLGIPTQNNKLNSLESGKKQWVNLVSEPTS